MTPATRPTHYKRPVSASPSRQLKSRSSKVTKRFRGRRQRKSAEKSVHSAVLELTETLVKYKNEEIARLCTIVSSTYHELAGKLANEHDAVEEQTTEQEHIRRTILASLEDEILSFTVTSPKDDNRVPGQPRKVQQTLGERATRFENKMERTLTALDTTWEGWQICRAESVAAVKELQEALEDEAQLIEDLNGRGEKMKTDLDGTCETHVQVCHDKEKVFNIRKAKQRKKLMMMLASAAS